MYKKLTLQEKEVLYLKAKDAYYNAQPIMSDFEFDELEEQLKKEGSKITSIVGAGVVERFKRKHLIEQKSLAKIQVNNEDFTSESYLESELAVNKWFREHKANYYLIEPKYDGNAATVYYVNSVLDYVLSRGDGAEGSDITSKIKHSLPKQLKIKFNGILIIKGEICIKTKTFNEKYLPLGFKNPRNFVAGKLNPENDEVCEDIDFIPYEMTSIKNGKEIKFSDEEVLGLGFKVNPKIIKKECYPNFKQLFTQLKKYRESESEFQLDGFVIKTDLVYREVYGEKSHHPNWAVAIKFPPQEKVTTIIDVEWQLGKTGELTPVAVLEPIMLDGSEVTRTSLHNLGYILEKETYIGSSVIIAKKGDIIPQIIKVVSTSNNFDKYRREPKLLYPKTVNKVDVNPDDLSIDGVHLYWDNEDGINIKKMQVAIKLLKVDDLGGATIEKLYEEGLKTVFDLFNPEVFNKKMLQKVFTNDDSSMPDKIYNNFIGLQLIDYWKIFNLLQVENLGETLSKKMAEHYVGITIDFKGMNKELTELLTNKNSILSQNVKKLEQLVLDCGFAINYPVAKVKSSNIITYEMTGSWAEGTKSEFEDAVRTFAEATKLTKETNYLVCEDTEGSSSKIAKANKLGVTVITYEDFLKLNK
jgi:DNA ligase (NAD+)